ncbi:hypothetical protein AAW28_07665 [Lacticaseibacillus casei]|nr:hypothetical protein AAW28_07665 [Lacticaseibacillus casei]
MKKSTGHFLIAGLLLLVIGVSLDLIMVFGGKSFSQALSNTILLGAQQITLISVYLIYRALK